MVNLPAYTELLKYFAKWPRAGGKYRARSGAALIEVNDRVIQWPRGEEGICKTSERLCKTFVLGRR